VYRPRKGKTGGNRHNTDFGKTKEGGKRVTRRRVGKIAPKEEAQGKRTLQNHSVRRGRLKLENIPVNRDANHSGRHVLLNDIENKRGGGKQGAYTLHSKLDRGGLHWKREKKIAIQKEKGGNWTKLQKGRGGVPRKGEESRKNALSPPSL